MPLIDPIQSAQIRRHWQLVTATAVFVVFMIVHLAVFNPAAARYQRSVKQAAELGLTINKSGAAPIMPPRVLSLVTANALPAAEATQRGDSGVLTAALLEDLSRMIGQHGMEVTATEPGATAQMPKSVQVRARVKVSGTYSQFVAFLDALSRSGKLIAVDRFRLVDGESGRHDLELWVSRYYVKQEPRP